MGVLYKPGPQTAVSWQPLSVVYHGQCTQLLIIRLCCGMDSHVTSIFQHFGRDLLTLNPLIHPLKAWIRPWFKFTLMYYAVGLC